MEKRVFLIVLDSFGIGAEPDAAAFGDAGTNTLGAIANHPNFNCPNLRKLGLFNIDGVTAGEKTDAPAAAFARLQEQSMGKDTTIGHWEIAGVVSPKPLPTFPDGCPDSRIHEFEEKTGHKVLCNKPYSGTQVLKDYGEQAMRENALIVYTSADSVFQVAANEELVPVQELYRYCEIAREMLKGAYGVGRVIARPFLGSSAETFYRTTNRHDLSLKPPRATMLDLLKDAGKEDKLDEVLAEIPRVREDAGYPPLVTPTSQIVGTQAVFNVIMGERYKMVTKEFKGLVHGDYGKTPAPIKPEFTKKILGDEQPITCRFADTLAPEMDKLKAEAAKWATQEEDVLTYAMFPQVAPKFFDKRNAKKQGVDGDHVDYTNQSHPV